jgi:hypothetical protein
MPFSKDTRTKEAEALAGIFADEDQRQRQRAEYDEAVSNRSDRWVAACNGLELPTLFEGTRWLYVFNPARGEHGYLNLDTDLVQAECPFSEVR